MRLDRKKFERLEALAVEKRDRAIESANYNYKLEVQSIAFVKAMMLSPVSSCGACVNKGSCQFPIREFNVGCPSIASFEKTKGNQNANQISKSEN